MDSILTSLQSIPRPSFLRSQNLNTVNLSSSQLRSSANDEQQVQRNINSERNTYGISNEHPLSAFNRLETAATTIHHNQSSSHLPAVSFTDFGQWDLQPFNELFIRDRLRRRIEQNKAKYSKIGIIAQSVPLHLEIESIRDLLLCGGTVGEVRMSRNSQSLSVIVSYSKLEARAMTKSVAQMDDEELGRILMKYNNLRRTTLIHQPCLLCGIYDYYFLQFLVSMIKKLESQRIEQDLMRFITKSLIYCVVMEDIESFDILRDTTLDLLNYEALHSLLMALNCSFTPCTRCISRYQLFGSDSVSSSQQNELQKPHRIPRDWLTKTLNVLLKHGLNRQKTVKNGALEHETAVMNPFNFQWIEVRQIIMIQLLYHPMATNPDDDRYGEFVVIWTRFYSELLSEWNAMKQDQSQELNKDPASKPDAESESNFDEHHQMECDRMALEIQLTVFESILKAVIGHTFLLQIIAFLAHKTNENEGIWTEYDLLIMLLFCGHFKGYHALLRRTKYHEISLGTFEEMLCMSNVIPSNLKDIGRIIAVRSCCFVDNPHFLEREWIQEYAMQFVQCLKSLFYDHNLYDFEADELERGAKKRSVSRNEDVDGNEDDKESEELDTAECVGMISMGLKSHKKFLMECAFVNIEILQCLLELKLLDKEYLMERFRNTYDFIEYERGIDAKQRWHTLKKRVFVYNQNVVRFRGMKEKELRMLFRGMIRVVVGEEFREWMKQYVSNGGQSEEDIDKAIKIAKRGEIEDRYKISTKTMRLIQSFV